MAVNLSKGQKISLDKGMTLALVGLGWAGTRTATAAARSSTWMLPRSCWARTARFARMRTSSSMAT